MIRRRVGRAVRVEAGFVHGFRRRQSLTVWLKARVRGDVPRVARVKGVCEEGEPENEFDEQFGLKLVVRRREETEPEKEALEKGLRKQRIEGVG